VTQRTGRTGGPRGRGRGRDAEGGASEAQGRGGEDGVEGAGLQGVAGGRGRSETLGNDLHGAGRAGGRRGRGEGARRALQRWKSGVAEGQGLCLHCSAGQVQNDRGHWDSAA
jgi:hypothetical protein